MFDAESADIPSGLAQFPALKQEHPIRRVSELKPMAKSMKYWQFMDIF